jgi:hypothetical protein
MFARRVGSHGISSKVDHHFGPGPFIGQKARLNPDITGT